MSRLRTRRQVNIVDPASAYGFSCPFTKGHVVFTERMSLCCGYAFFLWGRTAPVLLMKDSHNHFGNRPLRWSFGLSAMRKAKGAGHFFECNACLFKVRL